MRARAWHPRGEESCCCSICCSRTTASRTFGAAVRPMCAEAELLSYIDLIDSRMEIYAETLPGVPAGGFSGRIFALEKKIYHHN